MDRKERDKKERNWFVERSLRDFALIIMVLMLVLLIIESIMSYCGRGERIADPLVYVFIAMVAGLFGIVDRALKRQRAEIMELRHKIGRLEKGENVDSQTPSISDKKE